MSISAKALRLAAGASGSLVVIAAANYYLNLGWFGGRPRLVLSLTLLLTGVVIVMAISHKEIGPKIR
jgi:hypothetical protein